MAARSPGISPDLDSVQIVLFSGGFLASNPRFLQCLTGPFQALIVETRAENLLPRKSFPRNLSAVDGRGTGVAVGRELTKGILSPDLLA